MKLKNVVVGSDIEAKHDTKFFTEGEVVKVLYKEDSDCEDSSTLKLENSKGEKLWSNHKYFRRPRPKKIDQSIFDGVDSRYSYFAIDEDGMGGFYDQKPELCGDHFTSGYGWQPVGHYDATDWKNSLIERESKELTGSELCKAILGSGANKVLVRVTDYEDVELKNTPITFAYKNDSSNIVTEIGCDYWAFITPINNQGEPLTAKDVGL